MFNFDEAKVLQEHKNGLSIVGATEKAVDEVIKRGYKNIFYIGIGGTVLYANQMAHIVREEGSTIPLFIENAADFCVVDNPHFSKDSVVVIESISGDTKEVVAAVDKAHEIGATVNHHRRRILLLVHRDPAFHVSCRPVSTVREVF